MPAYCSLRIAPRSFGLSGRGWKKKGSRSMSPPTARKRTSRPAPRPTTSSSSTSCFPRWTADAAEEVAGGGHRDPRAHADRPRTRRRTRSPASTPGPTTTSTKPFELDELLARIRALIRRGHQLKDPRPPLPRPGDRHRRPHRPAGRPDHPPDAARVRACWSSWRSTAARW